MKAPINEETKAAFMAQYYSQPVRYEDGEFKEVTFNFLKGVRFDKDDTPLSLRDISSLTDEERVDLANITGLFTVENLINSIRDGLKYNCQFAVAQNAIDYLRERSILLPFRGIPCEEILQAGWAQIRKEGE
jgi:hypothetical protein